MLDKSVNYIASSCNDNGSFGDYVSIINDTAEAAEVMRNFSEKDLSSTISWLKNNGYDENTDTLSRTAAACQDAETLDSVISYANADGGFGLYKASASDVLDSALVLEAINSSAFDFLPKGSKDAYPLRFRIIRIKISEGMYETLVTNLPENEFSADDIKKIYKMRWGIETSFRELKYHVGLIAFHSKKKECIIQEIYARLIMYNFSMLITENILIDDDMRNKYRSRVNYAVAIHICIAFFRCNNVSPSHLEKLIARNTCPVRPVRNAVRKTRYHSAIPFNYRLS